MSGFLDALAHAPRITATDFLGDRPLVVLAPHPDDETLGCGGLIFDAARLGIDCHVICVTDGSKSHLNSRQWPAPRLARQRRTELSDAMAILAPRAQITWLGYPDCHAPSDDVTAGKISSLVPHCAMVLASWDGDPHIDHERVAQLARHLAAQRPDTALAFYPIWGRFGDRTVPGRLLTASGAAKMAKAAALACHRTQMSALIDDDVDGFVMEGWQQAHFLTHPEILIAL